MIRLFIENIEIELPTDVQVALNKEFEELTNPTIIINDWSKTVSIPFTAKNNQTFGHIYTPDRIRPNSYGTGMGVNFNPLKKLDFRIEWNNAVLMTGYAKMNTIKQVNGKGTYDITLFGELGKVFQELSKITFDTTTEDTNYLINGEDYVAEKINQNLIYSAWTTSSQAYSTLYPKYLHIQGGGLVPHPAYRVTDIIGFAPNNSFSDGFDHESFQPSPTSIMKFIDVLKDADGQFAKDTGIEPDTVIPDGMLPREIGEYRSYMQLPYVYWNKLFQMFQYKAEEVTGYSFDLDPDWFNDNNPYWHDLVYMLKTFNTKDGTMTDNANSYVIKPYSSFQWQTAQSSTPNTLTTHRTTNIVDYENEWTETVPMVDSSVTITDGKWFCVDTNTMYPIFKLHTEFILWDANGSSSTSKMNTNNALVVIIKAEGQNGHIETNKFLIKAPNCTITEEAATEIEYSGSTKADNAGVIPIESCFFVNKALFGNSVRFRVEGYWKNQNWPLTSNGWLVNLRPNEYDDQNWSYMNVTLLNDVHRSYGYFTFNDLWNNDYNVFGEILKYCKMYRILISVDEFNKKIYFKPCSKYFSTYSITDWTDKIDMSQDYTITPITFENKYVLFNYKDSETKLGEEYKERYGVNYGEYRLVTDYNFNGDTTELFEDVTPSINNTDNVLSWTNLYDYHKIVYSFPSELYVYNKDNDNKQVDVFGAWFFHDGLAFFSDSPTLRLRSVSISDDTPMQQACNTYVYTQDGGSKTSITTYPYLNIVKGRQMCVFNVPKENYTYYNNYAGKHSIYYNFWQKYIAERYNVNNKKITCHVNLKPADYSQFAWNKLVKIGNQLCVVNKIYDYDIQSNKATKVDLITVQNVEGYSTDYYSADYIRVSSSALTIPYDSYKKIIVSSSANWEINSDDWSENLVAWPQSGTSGETAVFIGTIDEEIGGTITFNLLEGTEVIENAKVRVTVGGTNTITASPWYNQVTKGGYTFVDINSSGEWSIIASDNRGNVNVNVERTSGSSGLTRIRITASSTSNTGFVDFYVQNSNADITSFRVNVVS